MVRVLENYSVRSNLAAFVVILLLSALALNAWLHRGSADVDGAFSGKTVKTGVGEFPWGPDSPLHAATYTSGCPAGQLRDADECVPLEQWLAGRGFTSTCTVDADGQADARTIAGCGYSEGQATVVRAGTYREDVRPTTSHFALVAYPGEHSVVSGADVAAPGGWTPLGGGVWRHAWVWAPQNNGNGGTTPGRRRELVVVGGVVIRGLGGDTFPDVTDGRFWVEGPPSAPRAVYLNPPGLADPNASVVEIGQRATLFWPGDADGGRCRGSSLSGLLVAGMTFQHGTSNRQRFAVCLGASGGTLLDSDVEWQNGGGVDLSGSAHKAIGNRINDNGIEGVGGTAATDALVAFNEVRRNGWDDPTGAGHGGGGKFTRSRGLVVRNNVYADNAVNGLWLDVYNRNAVVAANLFARNENAGVFLELFSDSSLVANNLCVDNRVERDAPPGAAQLKGCIRLTDVSASVVAFNTVVNASNAALSMFADDRSLWPCDHDGDPACRSGEAPAGQNPYPPTSSGEPWRSYGNVVLNNILMARARAPYTNTRGQKVALRGNAVWVGAAGAGASHVWGGNVVWTPARRGGHAYSARSVGAETDDHAVWAARVGEVGGATFADPFAVLADTVDVAGMLRLAAGSPARGAAVPVPPRVYDLFAPGPRRDAAVYQLTHDAWGNPRRAVSDSGASQQ